MIGCVKDGPYKVSGDVFNVTPKNLHITENVFLAHIHSC